jgi:hypothetical protein
MSWWRRAYARDLVCMQKETWYIGKRDLLTLASRLSEKNLVYTITHTHTERERERERDRERERERDVYTCIHTYTCIRLSLSLSLYIYIYIYRSIYTSLYLHLHTHTHTHRSCQKCVRPRNRCELRWSARLKTRETRLRACRLTSTSETCSWRICAANSITLSVSYARRLKVYTHTRDRHRHTHVRAHTHTHTHTSRASTDGSTAPGVGARKRSPTAQGRRP